MLVDIPRPSASAAAAAASAVGAIGPIACGDHHTVLCATTGAVYTFGFGGYGRLGHSDANDRMRPTHVQMRVHASALGRRRAAARAPACDPVCPACARAWRARALLTDTVPRTRRAATRRQAKACDVAAGGTCSYARTKAGATFFWGRTKTTGEATMYPKPVTDLHGWSVRALACGHTSTAVAADRSVITWGPSPAYGELGYGDAGPKSSTQPKLVDDLEGALVHAVAAGYACTVLIADMADEKSAAKVKALAELVVAEVAADGGGGGGGEGGEGSGGDEEATAADEDEDAQQPKGGKRAAPARKGKAGAGGSKAKAARR